MTTAVLAVAKNIAKKVLDALKGEFGDAVIESAKKLVDAKIEMDKEMVELAKEELRAWRSAFGALPPSAHPVAQIIRASVRPLLTLVVTAVVCVLVIKGQVDPVMFVKAWMIIVGAWFGERVFRHYIRRDE